MTTYNSTVSNPTCNEPNGPLPRMGVSDLTWVEPDPSHYTVFHTAALEDVLFLAARKLLEGDKEKAHQVLMGLVEMNRDTSAPKRFWLEVEEPA